MLDAALVGIDTPATVDIAAAWLADLARAGLRRVTLLHAITNGEDDGALDRLRSAFDRVAVQLSALDVDAELALKRGDPARWMSDVADLRSVSLLLVGTPAHSGTEDGVVARLFALSRVPILVMPAAHRTGAHLLERPHVVSGPQGGGAAMSQFAALLPEAAARADPHDASQAATLLVTDTAREEEVLDLVHRSVRPVLVFPAAAANRFPPSDGAGTVVPPRSNKGAATGS